MRFLSSLIIIATAAIAQSWNSRLLPNVNGTFTPQTVNFAGRNWTLDDFSYAGYFLGVKSLGSVPCKSGTCVEKGQKLSKNASPGHL